MRRVNTTTLLTVFALLLAVTFTGCTKDLLQSDNQSGEDIAMVSVNCSVDMGLNGRSDVSVMSFGDGCSLDAESVQLKVLDIDRPQMIVVADADDHILMLYRGVLHEGQTVELNSHTSALAMITAHPLVSMVGDSDYASIIRIIENLQSFPELETLVASRISSGADLFDTLNTQLLNAVKLVMDELLGSAPTADGKDAGALPWADYSPLRFEWVNESQGKFNLSNYSLVPTYYGTISTPEGRTDKLVLPTVGSYSFVGAAGNLIWRNTDAFYGSRVPVSLTKGTDNTIELTNLHDVRAVVDFGARLVGDMITIFGFPMPEGFRKDMAEMVGGIVADAVANITANSDQAMHEAADAIMNGVKSYVSGKVTEWLTTGAVYVAAEGYGQEWAKRIWKIGVSNIFKWYSMTEGTANLSLRVYYYIRYPNDITFCMRYSDNNEIGQCCDCNIAEGDWVDLGLPSGLLWATRNVGAASPTDYGDYFAWGETSPKNVYDWSTYRYAVYNSETNGYDMTKYNGSDGLTILQPGDDAATVNYGGHTPSSTEWQELIDNSTLCFITINGVRGSCFTGPNGNSIFLPNPRYSVYMANSILSSLGGDYSLDCFIHGGYACLTYGAYFFERACGRPIRAVGFEQ